MIQNRLTLSLCVLLVINSTVLSQASFQGLGFFEDGFNHSSANSVSNNNVVVGYAKDGLQHNVTMRWTEENGMVNMGLSAGVQYVPVSYAYDISADGMVTAGSMVTTTIINNYLAVRDEAFRWTEQEGMVGLGHLPGPGPENKKSYAHAVSSDGSVIVGASLSSFRPQAFRWTEQGGMVGLGDFPGPVGYADYSRANDVSADGSVIVGVGESSSGREAFIWTEQNGLIGLSDLPGGLFQSEAYVVSANGQVVAGRGETDFGYEFFRWTQQGGMVSLGSLVPNIDNYSKPTGITADGSIIVGNIVTYAFERETFIWDETNGIRNLENVLINDYGLDLTGWSLRTVGSVASDGQTFVGTGINPDGFTEAWIATIPEPATLILLALGSGILRKRKH